MDDNDGMLPNKTILVIDDEYAITELLSIILRSQSFDVITANNAEVGLQLIAEKSPDAITLDLMMPEVNSSEMCEKIRSISKAPILVLSAINDPDIIANVLDSGADDYIAKPVSSAVLIARLNMLIRRAGGTGTLQRPNNSNWLPGSTPVSSQTTR
jgi:two-component system, OmpR family, KDP operon response regulator KdpE